MANDSPLKALLIAEGSGGHLIPALEVAETLAHAGVRVKVWYAQRRQTAPLARVLAERTMASGGNGEPAIEVDPIPVEATANPMRRAWQAGQLWQQAQRCFASFAPDIVVGFGGWVSVPILLAAKQRRIGYLLHEQNVAMGRANRWLSRWADRVALSFPETLTTMSRQSAPVMTGLPVRRRIGQLSRIEAARHFAFHPARPTLLVLGGSQGARTLNRLMLGLVPHLSEEERDTWQVLHIAGPSDVAALRQVYAAAQLTARVIPFLAQMEMAYALADVAIARAGASTVAELSRCGIASILIPYPYAGGHQRMNAQLIEAVGGGVVIEESQAIPARLLTEARLILSDRALRGTMGERVKQLQAPGAAERLSRAILEAAREAHHEPAATGAP